MGKLSGVAVALILLLSSCAKTVDIVVKNEAERPSIGAHVYIFTENIPEIEKDVAINKQWREQNNLEERLVVAGLSVDDAKKKAKEQYDGYHEERPDLSPYGYVTKEMRSESAKMFTDKWMEIIVSDVITGETNAAGTLSVKLKEGDYHIYIEGSPRELRYYGPFSVRDSGTKVFKL